MADTDLHAFELGLRSCGYLEPGRERIVRILDTLHLEDIYVSPAILGELSDPARFEVLGP